MRDLDESNHLQWQQRMTNNYYKLVKSKCFLLLVHILFNQWWKLNFKGKEKLTEGKMINKKFWTAKFISAWKKQLLLGIIQLVIMQVHQQLLHFNVYCTISI